MGKTKKMLKIKEKFLKTKIKKFQKITYAEKKEYKNLERQISIEDEKNVIETSFKDSTMDFYMKKIRN